MSDIVVYFEGFESIIVDKHAEVFWQPPKIELTEKIDSLWEDLLEEDKKIWNHGMARLESAMPYKREKVLRISTSLTTYKDHVGTRNEEDRDNRANPIIVCANIVTSDNKLVFMERQNCVRWDGLYGIITGKVIPSVDFQASEEEKPSLRGALYRTLTEKMGITSVARKEVKPVMVFGTENERTCRFLYEVELAVDSAHVQKKVDFEIERASYFKEDVQIGNVRFIDRECRAIHDELAENGSLYTPIVNAMLGYAYECKCAKEGKECSTSSDTQHKNK